MELLEEKIISLFIYLDERLNPMESSINISFHMSELGLSASCFAYAYGISTAAVDRSDESLEVLGTLAKKTHLESFKKAREESIPGE